ncbi:MAG: PqqD family protein [Clostridia bacterium]|nr:PqqD family protein [Clostridia bacterium]
MKIKSGFVLEKVGGGYLAVAVGARAREFSGLVRMNGTGAFLWNKLCEADMTVEELLSAVMAEYEGVPEEQALADITAFRDKLMENGIIE